MAFFKQIKQYFNTKETKSVSNSKPTLLEHKPLVRNAQETESLLLWESSNEAVYFYEWIKKAYKDYTSGQVYNRNEVNFVQYPGLEGIVIYFQKEHYNFQQFVHMFDSLCRNVQLLSYTIHQADSKKYELNQSLSFTHRYYLKPDLKIINWSEKIPQKFGNISIELSVTESTPKFIKLSASTYNDRRYCTAFSFQKLINAIGLSY